MRERGNLRRMDGRELFAVWGLLSISRLGHVSLSLRSKIYSYKTTKIFVRGTCVLNNVNFDKGYLKGS